MRSPPRDSERRRACAAQDTRRWLGIEGRSWQVALRPCAEGECPLAGADPSAVHGATTIRAARLAHSSILECCLLHRDSELRRACVAQDTRRWLSIGVRSWLVASRSSDESKRPLASTEPSYRIYADHSQREQEKSVFFASAPSGGHGGPWRPEERTQMISLRSCLMRKMRVYGSFKSAFCGLELPMVSLQRSASAACLARHRRA